MPNRPTHPGKIVKAWREARGWSPAKLGEMAGTSRQNIENLEKGDVRNPQYLPALAKVMGYASSDDLRQCKEPPTTITPANPGEALPVSQSTPSLQLQAWEGVMNRSVLPVWDSPRWVAVPDDALAPEVSRGDGVELIPIGSADELQVGDVVLVEDEPGNRWLRVFSVDAMGAKWARSLRTNRAIFTEFHLAESGWPRVIARMENHSKRRRGL